MIRHKLWPLLEILPDGMAGAGALLSPLVEAGRAWRDTMGPATSPNRRELTSADCLGPLVRVARRAATANEAGTAGRQGRLEVRLARNASELRQAQRLRFQVFYEEMSARAHPLAALLRRDADRFDRVCDHLVVIDHGAPSSAATRAEPPVVGTYRLLRQDVAERNFGFYSRREFDIAPLLAAHSRKRFLELGRSCVLAGYRDRRTLELLWRGIHAYVARHGIEVMIGCASLAGTDQTTLAQQLSFLHHHAPSPDGWRVRARPERYVPMDILPKAHLDTGKALRSLPPLVKGYLRLGASFGDGAVIDHRFGTTDVLVVLPTSAVSERYHRHLGARVDRQAA